MSAVFPAYKMFYHPKDCPICLASEKDPGQRCIHLHDENRPLNDYNGGWDDGREWAAKKALFFVEGMKSLSTYQRRTLRKKLYKLIEDNCCE